MQFHKTFGHAKRNFMLDDVPAMGPFLAFLGEITQDIENVSGDSRTSKVFKDSHN